MARKKKKAAPACPEPVAHSSKKSLQEFRVPGTKKKYFHVTCTDYRAWVDDPTSITDCDQRIAIIRHASTCQHCLQFVLKMLSEMPDDEGKDVPPSERKPRSHRKKS